MAASESTDRKLASIQIIQEILPIKDADNIVLARINGWRCVVAKNYNLNVGDKCVYFEIDSRLPKIPLFDFLEKTKYIVKTKKIRGVLSQGLIMPISSFSELNNIELVEDLNVTELLSVTKHDDYGEESVGCSSLVRHGMPGFLKKTECERIQNIKKDISTKYCITEKLDGSSASFGTTVNGKLIICSRRMDLTKEYVPFAASNTHWYKAMDNYDLKKKLLDYPGLILQGEIVGPAIQANYYKRQDVQFYVFRIHDLNTNKFLSMTDMIDLCNKLSVPTVPIMKLDSVLLSDKSKDEWLSYCEGKSVLHNVEREGVVLTPLESIMCDDYYSIKVISNKFLLKQK